MTRARDIANLGNNTTNLETLDTLYGDNVLTGRNLIINGAMTVAQRSTSETNFTGSAFRTVDRVRTNLSGGGAFDQEQSTDVPSGQGFINSLKTTVNTVDSSIAAGDYYGLEFPLEGQNVNSVSGFGTSGAKNLTLSFWVKSSVTGNYSVSFQNGSFNTSYVSKYTISSADTWEKKTISIDAKTDGTWVTTNAKGVRLWFSLGTGSTFSTSNEQTWESANYVHITGTTQWVSNASATFFITGVQLEIGDTATPFEHEGYGTTLAKCQRYLPALNHQGNGMYATGKAFSSTGARIFYQFKVPPRTNPTGISISAAGDFKITNANDALNTVTAMTFQTGTNVGCRMAVNVASGLTAGHATELYIQSSSAQILFTGVEL